MASLRGWVLGVGLGLSTLVGQCLPRPAAGPPHPLRTAIAQPTQLLRAQFRQAQFRRIDSVRALVRAAPRPDTVRLKLLISLADQTQVNSTRAAGPARRAAAQLAAQLNYRDFLAETLLDVADYYISQARYDSARAPLLHAQRDFKRLHDVGGQMRCLGRLGRIADQQGRFVEALNHFFRAMAMGSVGNERRFNTSLKIQVGSVYTRLGEYATAQAYLLDALAVARQHDYPDRINLIMGELGELNRYQGKWAAARHFYELSIAVSRRINITDQATVLNMDYHLADVTERLGAHADALAMGHNVLREAQLADLVLLVPRVQTLLAQVSLQLDRPDSAIWYGQRGLLASRQARYQEGLLAAYDVLARAYARQHQWAAAYQAQRQFDAYSDSLAGAAVARRTAALQFSHALVQQQARIRLLTQQRELERLRRQWQVAGVIVLLLLLLLAIAAGLWAYRQRQRRREQALRTSLAADLHDDVGTLLSQISLQSGLLQEGLADAAGQRQQLSQISDASRSAVRQLNDVVWSLDAHNDHLPNLLDRMRDYAHDVLGTAGLEVAFDFPQELPVQRLPVLLRRNLYLIYKESLFNIIKHAHGATEVRVSLHLKDTSPGWLVLQILDNGQPLASVPAAIRPGHTRRSGHGLRNIEARALALGGTAASGFENTGFRVQVAVPLVMGRKGYGLNW